MSISCENYGFAPVCLLINLGPGLVRQLPASASVGACGAIGPSRTADAATAAAWKPSPSYIVPVVRIRRRRPLARRDQYLKPS